MPNTLKPLAKLLEKQEPKVLVFVGAGVSIGATSVPHASWLGLLKHGIDYLVETNFLDKKRSLAIKESIDAAFSPFD